MTYQLQVQHPTAAPPCNKRSYAVHVTVCVVMFAAGGSGYNPITGEPFDSAAQVCYVLASLLALSSDKIP